MRDPPCDRLVFNLVGAAIVIRIRLRRIGLMGSRKPCWQAGLPGLVVVVILAHDALVSVEPWNCIYQPSRFLFNRHQGVPPGTSATHWPPIALDAPSNTKVIRPTETVLPDVSTRGAFGAIGLQ